MEHLIPQEWFTGLPQWVLLLITAGAIAALIKGADWLVDGASGFAYRLGIPKVIVGATVVSLGTTSPECAVSVMAAWSGNAGLALGNAVGSVIADTGLIFGLGCILTVLPADRFVLRRQGWVQVSMAALLAVICYVAWLRQGDAAQVERGVGFIFLFLLAVYLLVSVRWARRHPHGEPFIVPDDAAGKVHLPGADLKRVERRSVPLLLLQLVAGLATVVVASRVLICAVTVLAERWGVPQAVIAGTIVAVGTSLPELTVGLASIIKGHKELLVGNVIGADILNVLFVIGASAAARPLPVVEPGTRMPEIFLWVHLPAMLAILFLFRVFIWSACKTGSFRRWFGVPLVLIYVAYVTLCYVLSA